MNFWIEILFWICVLGIAHTYFLFPLLMQILAGSKKSNVVLFSQQELPKIAIVLAVFNEEKVIEKKIQSTFNTNYPLDKITFLIGSDNSTDATNSIIEKYQKKYTQLKFIPFKERTGKAGIVNELVKKSSAAYLLFTDANVFFDENTIFELVKHFKNDKIGVVSANIVNEEYKKEGISFQEKKYLEFEKQLKYNEGKVWGTMIGAFGGCYSIVRSSFIPVPANYLMDDFYISMNVFSQGKKAILNKEAICYEDVSDKMSEEFRRKIRISAGNFQNLFAYKKLLRNPFSAIAFSFFSHKVLRWLTPFMLIVLFLSSIYLSFSSKIFYYLLCSELLMILLTFVEIILNRVNINIKVLRFFTHFFSMNLALFLGFFKFIKGVKTNVWKPTERFQ